MTHDLKDVQPTDLEPSPPNLSLRNGKEATAITDSTAALPPSHTDSGIPYRLYKRRFSGLLGFVSLAFTFRQKL
jgi:hypothetical protein